MHILSLILGILGVVLIFLPGVNLIFSPLLSAGAIVTGIISRVFLHGGGNEKEKTQAKSGIVLGVVGMALSLVLYGSCAWIMDRFLGPGSKAWKWKEINSERNIEDRIEKMERKLDEETKKIKDLIDKKNMEEGKAQKESEDSGKKDEVLEKYMESFAEKKKRMREEIKKWRDWFESMPIQGDSKGGETNSENKKPVKENNHTKDEGVIKESSELKTDTSLKSEKKQVTKSLQNKDKGESQNLKKTRNKGEVSDKEKLLSPYDYY